MRIGAARCLSILTASIIAWGLAPARAQDAPPNIVIILADDAALMDFGVFGGEARTPHIDALAQRGMMFTQAHTSPMCAPSRAMLLTGVDSHKAGIANLPEFLPPGHVGQPGYSGHLEEGVKTLAARLKPLGYRTYMTGKWHLGHGPGQLPVAHGFDRSFVLDASGADNWEKRAYLPIYSDALWFEDGQKADLPEDFYSSTFLVDRMIDYLGSDGGEAPFLAYVAFQAVHIPVQAPAEFTDNYAGVYDAGWETVREARWRRAQEIGLIPVGAPLAPRHPDLRAWESLSSDERDLMAKSMAVNAGMLEAMDHHIGRLVDHLRETGELDNTIFVVTSDNGPEPNDPGDQASMRLWLKATGYSRDIATLGEKGSYVWIGPEWASAAAGPGSLFKLYAANGGTRVPLIVTGPGISAGARSDAFTFVTDVAPTLIELAGGTPQPAPGEVAITGRSLAPVLYGATPRAHPPGAAIGMEAAGQSALFRDGWKLVRNNAPFGDGVWRLYDVTNDPGETRDLATQEPARFDKLMADYEAYARENGVLEVPDGYTTIGQLNTNYRNKTLRQFWWVPAGLVLLLAAGGYAVWHRRANRT